MKRYRPQLDGLRAVAVCGVLFQHYAPVEWSRLFSAGGWGVGLFFVLSGYLITGILLRGKTDREQTHRPSSFLKNFYIRRALRIMPVYYAALVLGWWLGVVYLRESFLWHAAFLSNIYFSLQNSYCGAISPFWSLAVEQHFYLFWPWMVWMTPEHRLKKTILGLILSGYVFRLIALAAGWNAVARAILTPCAFELLGTGALLAYNNYKEGPSSGSTIRILLTGGLCLYPLALLFQIKRPDTALTFALNGIVSCGFYYGLVAGAAQGFQSACGKWLEWKPIVYLGKLSYGIYLFHELIYSQILPEWNYHWAGTRAALAFTGTLILSIVSYELLETPIHNLKRYFPYNTARF